MQSRLAFAIAAVLASSTLFAADPVPAKPLVQGYAQQRIEEKLDRGVVAVRTAKGVYVSWRLLKTDGPAGFNVHRVLPGGLPGKALSAAPITQTTDFIDADAPAGPLSYCVSPATGGAPCTPVAVQEAAYHSIKLDGNHQFYKAAIADLDGDGRYDFVLKQPQGNVDPYVQYWKKSEDTYKIEAYSHDGKFLWRYDMGWAIEQGTWYAPYIVYDFDGDGKAEVVVKAGEGDPRDPDGKVTSGPEYLAILDGMTGKIVAKLDWPSREGFPNYNYYCRNQLSMAYLDGKTPCLLVQRGTYNTIKMVAYEYHGGKLRKLWNWEDTQEAGASYRGQGAHCLRAADIDGDGRDEVILGSACIDDNGQGLWTTRQGHPDHVYIGDLDPERPGLEIYYGMETKQKVNGMCMADAATGKILWGFQKPTRHVHGQGLVADLDPKHPGVECYSADTDAEKKFAFAVLHDAKGNIVGEENLGGFAPLAAYWDADAQRELIVKNVPTKLNGPAAGPRVEGRIVTVADIIGDWREEIITSVNGELRIYTTTIPAKDRRLCMMQDPFYRLDVTSSSQGYYQIPTPRELPR